MKKIFLILITFSCQFAHSQGLGIGSNPPHASAELDVNSTTRGMLIPRMTASQRNAITNPASGLLVFQTDNFLGSPTSLSGLYLYETNNAIVGWKRIAKAEEITNSGNNSWTISGTNQSSSVTGNVGIGTNAPAEKLHVVGYTQVDGNIFLNNSNQGLLFKEDNITKGRVNLQGVNDDLEIGTVTGNTTGKLNLETKFTPRLTILPEGNVGIGTLSPDKKLHVNGDILANGRLDADGVIEGAGVSSTGALYVNGTSLLQGAVTGNVTANFFGNINSNTAMSITDPSAILQLKSSASVDKGFVQLNGDHLRIGTNSGNTLGNIVFRNDGSDIMEMKKVGTGSWLQLNNNGVSNGVLQVGSTGNLSLINPVANKQLQLGNEIFIDNSANHVGIGTTSPTERLHVNGNQLVTGNSTVNGTGRIAGNTEIGTGRITSDITGANYNLLPVCYGRVAANGNKLGGTPNFTVERYSEGVYFIGSSQISASSIILINASREVTTHLSCTYEYYQGYLWVHLSDESGSHRDSKFNFVIYDP